ncbi:MAG: alkaline phosphatase [Spirochaetales bacterium]|nr:alkaline phosphatase [Spirochaetales bacterium]
MNCGSRTPRRGLAAGTVLLLLLTLVASPGFARGEIEQGQSAEALRVIGQAKYVFVFIGDGMGLPQVASAEIYANAVARTEIGVQKLHFTQFPAQGITTTYDANSFITDSASAATAIATGHKTLSGVINMDPGKTVKYKTIAEMAKERGMKVGIISSVSLDHATPACFYAKVPSRGNMYDIAVQMANSGFDFFGGGGLVQPRGKKGDQPDAIELAKANGYTLVNNRSAFMALRPGAGKVLAIDPRTYDGQALLYDMDRAPDDLSLADYTAKAIELLGNPRGFFIMVEGGKIDWACHANDAAAAIHDTIAFDAAVVEALEFYRSHPGETLIVVTGDHECGGMTIGFAGTKYETFFDKVSTQSISYVKFDEEVLEPYKQSRPAAKANIADLLDDIERYFGLRHEELTEVEKEMVLRAFSRSMGGEVERAAHEDTYLLYGGYEPLTVTLTHILNQKAGIGWTSYSHTGVPVPTYAIGVGQEMFDGYYDNTDIFRKTAAAMGIPAGVAMAQ